MSGVVLDTSAVLALLQDEPGGDVVAEVIGVGVVSAVNSAEVLTKLIRDGMPPAEAKMALEFCAPVVIAFDSEQAEVAAELIRLTQPFGLSLGDRACLALAIAKGAPVYTADRAWSELGVGVEVRLVR